MVFSIPFLTRPPKVAVLRLQGMISASGRGALNDQSLRPIIERAFRRGKPAAMALAINSPGGSPVQSSLIAARIRALSEQTGVPVYSFVEDVAASGGYWLACAADEIIADPGSIIGSIGVISAGFGLPVLLNRQGIERRVYTAGRSKSQLDPFRPEQPEDVARLQSLLDQMHEVFINEVRTRRGDRLNADEDIFNGEFWLAGQAQARGLIDGTGRLEAVMRERFGAKTRFLQYGARRGFWARFGASIATDTLAGIEERAAFQRFGIS